ncbi:MAG: glycerol-3-phosphate dehydrogenase [Betaproteobacteria bacterium]|nr:MAG: glycerol-3-phosphate dehydrogenase [Betaproteobacteria bacterium]
MHSHDLLIIGGGVNGAGIARDAAGRGLSVLLVEKGDLAGATSSASSKLIHGGLRYLEQYQFRLVAEALEEREVLLRIAAHLVSPQRFVIPHRPGARPRWMVRFGLFLYDHLGKRVSLPPAQPLRLDASRYASALKPGIRHGFVYSDCRVDDARLVIANAMDARARGAEIAVRTECLWARRERGMWRAALSDGREVQARAIVNTAGPWAMQVLQERLGQPSKDKLRLVKGSHVVLPRLYPGEDAFILQNDDGRVIFMIPYEGGKTLLGTTDVLFHGNPGSVCASEEEIGYLCEAANRYLAVPAKTGDALWHYAGIRALYDDGASDPSKVTRDYVLRIDDETGSAPVLSVFGGKITTYRPLAEQVLDRLRPYLRRMLPAWTSRSPLPGSDFDPEGAAKLLERLAHAYPNVPAGALHRMFRRHGTLAWDVLGDGDLGEHFGAGLYEREVNYFVEREWARTSDDVLWRRTKAGLHMTQTQRERLACWLQHRVSAVGRCSS